MKDEAPKQSPPQIPSPLAGEDQGGGDKGDMISQLIKLTFLNANPNPEIIAVDPQEGKVNYFIGNDPNKWRTNIPTYRAVVYKEVYPGIDIKFYGNNRQMEYDVIVKSGADPNLVKLSYEGIEGLKVTENGDLEIALHSPSTLVGEGRGEGNKIIQKRPIIYQEIDGKMVTVDGDFKILVNNVITGETLMPPRSSKENENVIPAQAGIQNAGRGMDSHIRGNDDMGRNDAGLYSSDTKEFTYTFDVAFYDKTHPLIIDPTLVYATYLGGSSDESSTGIAVDASGNVYMTGWTDSSDFPVNPGVFDPTYNVGCNVNGSCVDVFVVKIDASGSSLSYATYLGGSSSDVGHGIAVDGTGNVYVAGETLSSNFPTTPGAYDTTINGVTDPNGPADTFVEKLNATGAMLIYSTYLGGSSYESGNEDMAVDVTGNVYVTGATRSSDFPVTPGAYDTTINDSNGSGDAFVAKLDSSGSFLIYATYLGGDREDYGYGIAVDTTGNAIVTGETRSSDFPVTPGAYDTTFISNGDPYNGDAFVAKFNASGSLLSYATYLGGSSSDIGIDIEVDAAGNTYVSGITRSSDFPATSGAYDTTFNGGGWDGFVVKLNTSGSLISFGTYIGGSNSDGGHIAVDAAGNVYVGGGTDSLDFPTTTGAYDTTFNGVADAFVAKLNHSGSLLIYATYLGGSNFDGIGAINMDAAGNVYVTGWTNSLDFPPTAGAYDTTYNGGRDVFVVKLNFPIDLPRTGQTTCYDSAGAVITCAGTGQDGEIQAGVPWPDPRFTDNGDQTVTDNLTGLMWTKDANLMASRDPGFEIDYTAGDGMVTWQHALDYIAKLNAEAYLGYADWRLPNVNEAETLVNAEQSNTATWIDAQGFDNVQWDGFWWSSTSAADNPASAWFINMSDGFMGHVSKSSFIHGLYVWPVRSGKSGVAQLWQTGQTICYDSAGSVINCTGTGQDGELQSGVPWPNPRFTDNGDSTVTDNLSGLMWTMDSNLMTSRDTGFDIDGIYGDGAVNWQHALDYVIKLNAEAYLGYTDWRLPNRKEVHSLTDFSRDDPALPLNHPFLNVELVPSSAYWSSTTYAYATFNAWFVWRNSGTVGAYGKSSNYSYYGYNFVWPVRGGQTIVEVCDGIDNDGDGQIDEGVTNTYYEDADGDTYGNASVTTEACTQSLGYVSDNTDCDDGDAAINPGTAEVCNLVDDNCNAQIDEGVLNTYYGDADSDLYGNVLVTNQACTQPPGYVSNSADCNDSNASINPGVSEVCNGVDDNCNGQTDEGIQNTYYEDADGDTYGNASITTQACTSPSGYVSDNADCDDSNSSINPGATEIPNDGIDQDCNGSDLITPTKMTNISTRAWVGTGNDRAIGGFIIAGSTPKTVMVRGRGPSMSGEPFNLTGTLPDPYLRLYSSSAGAYIAQNDNWGDQSDPNCGNSGYVCGTPAEISASGLDPCIPNPGQISAPPGCSNESVIMITLPPGAYTAVFSGVNSGTGTGLVEIFDVDGSTTAKLVNISTRAKVLTGTNRVIGGFIVDAGTGSKQVLLRARGSSMSGAPFNITGTLSNPYLRLYSSTAGAYIAQNDNWGDQSDPLCASSGFVCGTSTDITATGLDPCIPNPGQTTAPPGCSNESAMLITLPSGSYTAVVSGVNDGIGVGLVEVFEVAP